MSEGISYKTYVKSINNNKYYMIDINLNVCRCIEDAAIFKIRRQIKKRANQILCNELITHVNNNNINNNNNNNSNLPLKWINQQKINT